MKEQIKTIIISLVLLAAVVGALIWFGNGGNKPEPAAIGGLFGGVLTAKETAFDFGSVPINGGLVDHEFMLENLSDKAVKIGEVSTSCMCTSAKVIIGNKIYGPFGMPGHLGASKADAIVNPDEKIIVKVTFDPAAHGPTGVGMIERQIFLNIGTAEPLVLNFKANVTP